MKKGRIVVFSLALASATMTGLMAAQWLSYTAENNKEVVTLPSPVKLTTVVVARKPLRYGDRLSPGMLKEVQWPIKAVPAGAFNEIRQVLDAKQPRMVLTALEQHEPVLPWKVTGPGQKASLAARLQPSAKAVTIRVNDVLGVGGFVLPGDRVDVLLTREEAKKDGEQQPGLFNQILLQNVQVLAIDQHADERSNKPQIAKTVTLEVDITGAQKLALAASVGSLSLALRQPGETGDDSPSLMSVADLSPDAAYDYPQAPQKAIAPNHSNEDDVDVKQILTSGRAGPKKVKIRVVRALAESAYDVLSEDDALSD